MRNSGKDLVRMKKGITLLLAAVLSLSLAACGGGSDPSNGDTAEGEETNIFYYPAFLSDIAENEVRAQDTYIGNAYDISGFVVEIQEDNCVLSFLSENGNGYDSNDYKVNVSLDHDALVMLNKDERVTISGTIDAVSGRKIDVSKAEYIGNTSSISGEILSFVYSSASDESPSYCIIRLDQYDNIDSPLSIVRLDGEVLSALAEGDAITAKGVLSVLSTNPLKGGVQEYHGEKILLELDDAELISE